MDLRALVKVMRAGDARTRLAAVRDGRSAVRLAMTATAVDSGLLDALTDGPSSTQELARRLEVSDEGILLAFLATLEAGGLVITSGGRHRLSRRGRSVRDDEVPRSSEEDRAGSTSPSARRRSRSCRR